MQREPANIGEDGTRTEKGVHTAGARTKAEFQTNRWCGRRHGRCHKEVPCVCRKQAKVFVERDLCSTAHLQTNDKSIMLWIRANPLYTKRGPSV